MSRDYQPKGVQFYYVYKTVQHPEINNFVSAFTLKERLAHVAEAKRRFRSDIPWICDNMQNEVKQAFGGAPNGEFVLDPAGRVVRKRFWSNPATLRQYLEEVIGPVEKVTTVADLPAGFTVQPRSIAGGVVPRIPLPRGLTPIKAQPDLESEHLYFAKLRAEATGGLLRGGKGQMYLGLYLDPLYKVHWNNRAGRVAISITPPAGVEVTPTTLQSPEVKADADIDPRQFLLELDGKSKEPLIVDVTYTVCDDEDTFCITIKQQYRISLERSRDLGSRPGIFMPAMFADVRKFDANKDGDITKDELPPGQVTLYVGHMDFNGNETIEKAEIDKFLAMFNNGRGFDSAKNDGQ